MIIMANLTFAEKQKSPTVEVISSEPASELTQLFKPQKRGWLGADGAASVEITKGKILWLFGDTILGNCSKDGKRTGTIVRNTLGLQDLSKGFPGEVEFFWDIPGNFPTSFFLAEGYDQDYWYWPTAGVMLDEELIVFVYKILPGPDPFTLGFEVGEMTLMRINNPLDPPNKWNKTIIPFGTGGNHQGFCSAIYVEKPYLYFLGFDDGPADKDLGRQAVLTRAKIEDIKNNKGKDALEFWTKADDGGKWDNKPENLLPLFKPGETETSLQYNEYSKQYISVIMHFGEPDIYIVTAPQITGPWSEPIKVYTTPEPVKDKNYSAYAAKAHPELAKEPDEIIITYIVSTMDFWTIFKDPNVYFPQFVRVKLKWNL